MKSYEFISFVTLLTQASAIFYLEERIDAPQGEPALLYPMYRLYRCYNVQLKKKTYDELPMYLIRCKTIYLPVSKWAIYASANFFDLYNPEVTRQVETVQFGLFAPRFFGRYDKLPPNLRVGFYPGPSDDPKAMDFPIFEQYGNRHQFRAIANSIKVLEAGNLISWMDVDRIAATFNCNVILKTSIRWDYDYPHYVKLLDKFTPYLQKIRIKGALKEPMTVETVERLAKMFLNKMIDPCSVPISDASKDKIDLHSYCKIHCQYLSVVKRAFKLSPIICQHLKNEGRCKNAHCMCTEYRKKERKDEPLKMLFCNNEFRIAVERRPGIWEEMFICDLIKKELQAKKEETSTNARPKPNA